MHPDHAGMAGWLTRKFGCRLWMTRLEYMHCRVLASDTGREAPQDGLDFYRRAGWSEAALETYRARFGRFGKHVYALPDSYRRLQDTKKTPSRSRLARRGRQRSSAFQRRFPELGVLISVEVLPRTLSTSIRWSRTLTRCALVPLARRCGRKCPPTCWSPLAANAAACTRASTSRSQDQAFDRLREALQQPACRRRVRSSLLARRGRERRGAGSAWPQGEPWPHLLPPAASCTARVDDAGAAWWRLRARGTTPVLAAAGHLLFLPDAALLRLRL
jgi:hypothetical protein